jgi:hypothetical protein
MVCVLPPHKVRDKSAADLELRQWLLDSIVQAVSENLPDGVPSEDSSDDDVEPHFKKRVFLAFFSPDNPNFAEEIKLDLADILHARPMHSRTHMI